MFKKLCRTIAFTLVFVMIITMQYPIVYAQALNSGFINTRVDTQDITKKPVDVKENKISEESQLNTETAKFFKNSDGSTFARVYDEPVQFKNNTGEWIEIDNSIIDLSTQTISKLRLQNNKKLLDKNTKIKNPKIITEQKNVTGYKYGNKAGLVDVWLSDDIEKDKAIRLDFEKYSIGFTPINLYVLPETQQQEDLVPKEELVISPKPLPNTDKSEQGIAPRQNKTNDLIDQKLEKTNIIDENVVETQKPVKTVPKKAEKQKRPIEINETHKLATIKEEVVNNINVEKIKEKKLELLNPEEKINESLVYKNTFDKDVDIKVTPISAGIKEEIILNSLPTQTEFSYKLSIPGLYPEILDTGRILLKDKTTTKEVFEIPWPYMIDSSNREDYLSYDVDVKIVPENAANGEYIFTMKPSRTFLESKETVYPVKIDPSVVVYSTGSANDIEATYVNTISKTRNYAGNGYIRVGTDSNGKAHRGLVKVNVPEAIRTNGLVTSAVLKLYRTGQTTDGGSTLNVQARHSNAAWSKTGVTWNNQPAIGDYIGEKNIIGVGWYDLDITGYIRVASNNYPTNNGFYLLSSNENVVRYKSLSSYGTTNRPYVVINYVTKNAKLTEHKGNPGTSQSIVSADWDAFPGATSYYVGIFNGKEYQWLNRGPNNFFYSGSYRLWPTPQEVQNGRYGLHINANNDAELGGLQFWPNDPRPTYTKAGGGYKDNLEYFIRINIYDKYGYVGQIFPPTIQFSDTTSPEPVPSVNAVYNSVTKNVDVTWLGTPKELPQGMTSGMLDYNVDVKDNGVDRYMSSPVHDGRTGEYKISYPASSFTENKIVSFGVAAVDKNINYAQRRWSNQIVIPERTIPPPPTTLTIDKALTNANPIITWNGITSANNNHNKLEWAIFKSTDNVNTANPIKIKEIVASDLLIQGSLWSNKANVDVSNVADGSYKIALRASTPTLPGSWKTVNFVLDKTKPTINNISIQENQNIMAGEYNFTVDCADNTVNNDMIGELYVKRGAKTNTVPYTKQSSNIIKTGSNTLKLNLTGFETNQKYTVRVKLFDKAGNYIDILREVIVGENATIVAPEYIITKPVDTNPNDTDDTIYVTNDKQEFSYTKKDGTKSNVLGELYIDNVKVATQSNIGASFTADMVDLGYLDGSEHSFYIKTKDTQNKEAFSSGSMRIVDYVYGLNDTVLQNKLSNFKAGDVSINGSGITILPNKSGFFTTKPIGLSGNVYKIKLKGNPIPNTTYMVSVDGKNWQDIVFGNEIIVTGNGNNLQIKCTYASSPTARVVPSYTFDAVVFDNISKFKMELIAQPTDLTAFEQANYTTWLRWTPSANDNLTIADDVVYQVYRGDTEGFVPDIANGTNRLYDDLKDCYAFDNELHYGKKSYYKIIAKKAFSGTASGQQVRYSVPSNTAVATTVPKEELNKDLGLQNHWTYTTMPSGKGTSYINMASGNLVYQSTDFANMTPLLTVLFKRTYNTQANSRSSLGQGWDFNYNTNLLREFNDKNQEVGMILKDGDGTLHRFAKNTDGSYKTPKGIYMQLLFNSETGEYSIKRDDNITYVFDEFLKIKEFKELNGNAIKIEYNTRGNAINVRHNLYSADGTISNKQYVQLYYDSFDRIERIENFYGTSSGQQISQTYHCTYDENNVLKRIYTLDENNNQIYEEFEYTQNQFVVKTPTNKNFNSQRRAATFTFDANNKVVLAKDALNYEMSIQYEASKTNIKSWINGVNGRQSGAMSYVFNPTNKNIITSIIDSGGDATTYSNHDDNYRPRQISYKKSEDTTITLNRTYDTKGNVLTATDAMGKITTYEYDSNVNKLIKSTTPISAGVNAVATNTYDAKGNLLTKKDTLGKTTTYTYNNKGYTLTESSWNDNNTNYTYDEYGRVKTVGTKMGNGEYNTVTYEYDVRNNPTKIKDNKGIEIQYTYNKLGYKTNSQNTAGYKEKWAYNPNGIMTSQRNNTSGNPTSYYGGVVYEYDELDRVTSTVVPYGKNADGSTSNIEETTQYGFNAENKITITKKDKAGNTSVQTLDAKGRVVKEQSGNLYTTYTYDKIGNKISETSQDGRIRTMTYDNLNRIVSETYGGITATQTYDFVGNVLTKTDGEGNVTKYNYDLGNRMKTATQTVAGVDYVTTYTYDQLVSTGVYKNTIRDAEGMVVEKYYDRQNNVIKEVNLGKNGTALPAKEYTFDVNNNLQSEKIGSTVLTTYEYNKLNQLVKKKHKDNYYTTYEYDLEGQNKKSTDYWPNETAASTSWTYDLMGRLSQMNQDSNLVNYTYNNVGNLTNVNYTASGAKRSIDYEYDSNYRLTNIKQDGKLVESYSYNAKGEVQNETTYMQFDKLGSGTGLSMVKEYTYDPATGLPTAISHKQNGTEKERYGATYDKRGYMITETVSSNYEKANSMSRSYVYDPIGRLTSTTTTNNAVNKVASYSYDKAGNRLTMTEGTDNYKYEYDGYNRLTGVKKKTGSVYLDYQKLTFDERGNQTKKEEYKIADNKSTIEKTSTNTYDEANQLLQTKIVKAGETTPQQTVTNRYNGDGKRIRREINGSVDKYYYMGDALFFSTDQNGVKQTENLLDPDGKIIASRRDDGSYINNYFFYHYDMRGSTTNILGVKDAGTIHVAQGYKYDEFGKVENVKAESSFKNDVTFTGAVSDKETGLLYMSSRHYDPSTGRFLQQDTYSGQQDEPWTQHLYSYCGNNPVNMVDPTGHFFITATLIGLGIGAAISGGVKAASNLSSGKNWDDGVWGAAAGTFVQGAVFIKTGNWAAASYVGAGVEHGVNNAIDVAKGKKSVGKAIEDTVMGTLGDGTFKYISGKVAGVDIMKNSNNTLEGKVFNVLNNYGFNSVRDYTKNVTEDLYRSKTTKSGNRTTRSWKEPIRLGRENVAINYKSQPKIGIGGGLSTGLRTSGSSYVAPQKNAFERFADSWNSAMANIGNIFKNIFRW